MSGDAPIPRLRLAPREPLEEMIHREERIQRAEQLQTAAELENALAPFRVGTVPYLNGAPLTRGLEEQVLYAPPAQLAEMLRRDELDAALVSITEVLLTGRYDVLDGIAIASLGEVLSVLLAHRAPLEEVREVHCDPASLTSVHLLKVLLAERGLRPAMVPLEDYAAAPQKEAVLLIGDAALEFLLARHEHQIWDLGAAWLELTGKPFVYAAWALRRGVNHERLRRLLREAKAFGMETLDYIIASRTEFNYNFRKDYLTWHLHYHLGSDEKAGVARFGELLEKHGLGPVHPVKYIY